MSLTPGTRLGPYEVAALIGVGGMGEVYRALDTNLKRDVALKILPDTVVDDSTRLARLQREAELLAALNHPNIAHIYGLERSGDTIALVMELVEGTSLAERIGEGAVPVREALSLALQIASALEAAHERGIIHRDLKPDNVRVTTDGTVKVLDFGIAKALDPYAATAPRAPALTTPAATELGLVLGTAAYMSPEQARGKPVDKRADIWAFGCVLYEMLAGRALFLADDVTTTLARVLEREPDLGTLPAGTPAAVRRTLELCLKKDPKERLADIRDVKLALGGAFETGAGAAARVPQNRSRQIALVAAAVVASAAVTALAAWALRPARPTPTVSRFVYKLPTGVDLATPRLRMLDISRDGQSMVFATSAGLYLRPLGEIEGHAIPIERPPTNPMFSPDGQSIGFAHANGDLMRIGVTGARPTNIGRVSTDYLPAMSWSRNGTVLYVERKGVFRIPANGGAPELIVPARDREQLFTPELLPDGDGVLFTNFTTPTSAGEIEVLSLKTGNRTKLLDGVDARYVASGHIVFVAQNDLFAAPFDAREHALAGDSVPVVQRVTESIGAVGQYAVSDNGTLVYVRGAAVNDGTANTLSWVSRDGREEPVGLPGGGYNFARVSHDGRRFAVSLPDSSGNTDIWTSDIDRPVLSRITTSPGTDQWPVWSPDDRHIVFTSEGTPGIAWTLADGTGAIEPLIVVTAGLLAAGSWTPDGKALVFTYGGSSVQPKIGLLNIEAESSGQRSWAPLIDRPTGASAVNISPNGEWIAYQADDTGQYAVYIERFPKLGQRHLISDQRGGWGAIWSKAGDEVFYRRLGDGAMMSVPVQTSPTVTIGAPQMLFESRGYMPINTPRRGAGAGRNWDVAPDGRFLMIKVPDLQSESDIVVVENWFEELKRLAPPRK
jgi:serine/threonine-protein kinase